LAHCQSLRSKRLNEPLTVFVDGPTGSTFMYVLDEGWNSSAASPTALANEVACLLCAGSPGPIFR
jgi:hypothetical protein